MKEKLKKSDNKRTRNFLAVFIIFILIMSGINYAYKLKNGKSFTDIIRSHNEKRKANEDKKLLDEDPKNFIDVTFTDYQGRTLEVDKGVFKDSLDMKENFKLKIKNNSKDSVFEGSLIFTSGSTGDDLGNLKIGPGMEVTKDVQYSSSDTSYSIGGKMKKINIEEGKYNILAYKVQGSKNETVRVAISEPNKLIAKEIANDFVKSYENEIENLTIYIYEQGKEVENYTELNKGSKYDLDVYKENGERTYNLSGTETNKVIETGKVN